MHVVLARSDADGVEISVALDDEITEYNPLRTSEMAGLARDLFRNVLADALHSDVEHEKPAE
jgi:hypothetical protein